MVDDGGLMVDDQQWIDYAIFCRKDVMPCELKVG